MKKKLLSLLLITIIIFTVVGCGNTASNSDNEKAIDQGNSGESDKTKETSDIKLYSTDDRLVFNANNLYYIVIDFDENGYATALKWIYDYSDTTTAKTMVSAIKANLDKETNVKTVAQDGKYVVVDYTEEAYKDLERSTAEAAFNIYQKIEEQ